MHPSFLARVPFRVPKSFPMQNANASAKILSSCPIFIVFQTPKPAKNIMGSCKIAIPVKFRREGAQVRFSCHLALPLSPKTYPKPLGWHSERNLRCVLVS